MDSSLSHFKATLQRRKARKEKKKGKFDKKSSDYKYSNSKANLDFPEVSESRLEHVKEQIRKDAKKRRLKQYIALTIIALLSILILHFID